MRKFTFLRKKIQAKDRALQEKLVHHYFDDLQLNQQPQGAPTQVLIARRYITALSITLMLCRLSARVPVKNGW
jgi:hypothetical protein